MLADTPDAFAASVVRVLTDESLARQMGARAAETVRERFGWDKVCDAFCRGVRARRAQQRTGEDAPGRASKSCRGGAVRNSREAKMKLSVFGLGYVGCVSAACFAKEGHEVWGVEVNPLKVEIINAGKSPIVEAGVDELIAEMVAAGRLRATTDVGEAISDTEASLVCVGTPSNANGSLNLVIRQARVSGDRRGARSQARTAHRRHSQHDAAGHD